jgi:hypothetical protein
MLGLGRRMFPLLALALELDEDFFEDKVSLKLPGCNAETLISDLLLRHDILPQSNACYTIRPSKAKKRMTDSPG